MYTDLLYQAERVRTPQEQRELNARNGELAAAIRRPFLSFGVHIRPARPRSYARPMVRTDALACEGAATQSHCS